MMRPKVNIISLGCSKNLVDSEKIIANVAQKGGVICKDKNDADVIIINTCGFINSAKEESIDVILETARLKEEGRCKRLVVTGCLAQRYKDELQAEIPEIDDLIGLNKFERVSSSVFHKLNGSSSGFKRTQNRNNYIEHNLLKKKDIRSKRISLTPKHYAYLKISDGCNNCCTYCSIPAIRGKYRSRPIADIVNEAESLAASGVKELNIIAQDTTAYGCGTLQKQSLHLLLRKISGIRSIKWIRLMYTHPGRFYDELINEIACNKKICSYIDLPIQHINDEILKKMGRGVTRSQISRLIDKLRDRIPDLVLRTSIIAGFPGETEKQFDELADFIESTRFERLGVFVYSREENTPASSYKNQISKRLKNERYETLMAIQQKITFENNKKMIGKRERVLIDSANELQDSDLVSGIEEDREIQNKVWLGRYYADAPEVDSNVIITAKHNIRIGTFKDVIINGTDNYNLVGIVDKE